MLCSVQFLFQLREMLSSFLLLFSAATTISMFLLPFQRPVPWIHMSVVMVTFVVVLSWDTNETVLTPRLSTFLTHSPDTYSWWSTQASAHGFVPDPSPTKTGIGIFFL